MSFYPSNSHRPRNRLTVIGQKSWSSPKDSRGWWPLCQPFVGPHYLLRFRFPPSSSSLPSYGFLSHAITTETPEFNCSSPGWAHRWNYIVKVPWGIQLASIKNGHWTHRGASVRGPRRFWLIRQDYLPTADRRDPVQTNALPIPRKMARIDTPRCQSSSFFFYERTSGNCWASIEWLTSLSSNGIEAHGDSWRNNRVEEMFICG